ncbi:MAG TPA: CHRD domain-containing protein [Gemmatimonadaceae bacterium]|nr:CHRD domain-containing protein [Gemmatimonadaceae bacterium]
MRRTVGIAAGIIVAAAITLVAASCGDDSTGPAGKTYVANLIAANEGAGHTSPGSGVFTFVDHGNVINWTLDLTNITNVTASHIHLGAATNVGTTAGPVIINLFLPNRPPETGTLTGRVAEGTITNANNSTVSLDSLRVLFNNGNAYANVHTTANPSGEIRDQIHPAN